LVRETLSGKLNVLGVLPTGGGKTMAIWCGLAAQETGLTIVVFPLIALLADQVRRLQALFPSTSPSAAPRWRVWDAEQWHQPGVADATKLLLVDVDTARRPEFLQMLKENKNIARLVFDECSLYLESSFRKGVNTLPLLMASCTHARRVFLSATIPPESQRCLLLAMASPKTTVVRMPTVRQNLTLRVDVVDGSVTDRLFDVLQKRRPGTLAIVFVLSKQDGNQLQKALAQRGGIQAGFHHSDLSPSTKAGIAASWRSGQVPILLATSGFAYGVDAPNVSTVVHIGGSYSLAEYAQSAGRAGRNGSAATSTTLVTRRDLARLRDQQLRTILGQTTDCRRLALSRLFDGDDLAAQFGSCGCCDVCEKLDSPVEGLASADVNAMVSVADFEEAQPTAAQRVATVERCVTVADNLRKVKELGRCVFCFALRRTRVMHQMVTCPLWSGRCFRCGAADGHTRANCTVAAAMPRQLAAQDNCVSCALPVFAFNKTIHDGPGSVGSRCTYRDTVLPLALLLGHLKARWVSDHMGDGGGVSVNDTISFSSWLTQVRDGMTNAGFLVSAWLRSRT
jgi:superfamily II DNA helicase RecQ